jgi:hypothetical protein
MCRLSEILEASTSWRPRGLSVPVYGQLYIYVYLLQAGKESEVGKNTTVKIFVVDSSPNSCDVISLGMRWTIFIAHMTAVRSRHGAVARKPAGQRGYGRPRGGGNIKVNRGSRHGLDSFGLNRCQWRGVLGRVLKLTVYNHNNTKEKLLKIIAAILPTAYNYSSNIKFGY